ncbi:MAG TPA: hypothetical protein VER33_03620 [Polyangiaceae bacterium]|nr:hypothetical protein [Polyangiaceae bacterium]
MRDVAIALLSFGLLFPEPSWPEAASHATAGAVSYAVVSGSRPRPSSTTLGSTTDDELIRTQRVCVGSKVWSAGTLGQTLLYHYRRVGNELRVGYFAYWSLERPWGNNTLTYTLLPALVIDSAYSNFLFVLPGLRRAIYGAGDIEGALVVYEDRPDGRLLPREAWADDDLHRAVRLSRADLLMKDGRVVLLSSVWSHQLGSPGAAKEADSGAVDLQCFEGGALQPLTAEVSDRFRLGSTARPLRARPAWRATAPATSPALSMR